MRTKILNTIKTSQILRPIELTEEMGISRQMVQRYLKSMLEEGLIEKIGKPPKVFYRIKQEEKSPVLVLGYNIRNILDEYFYYVSPQGKELVGTKGFISWCLERDFDIPKKAQEFVDITKKYQKLRKNNLLNATSKLKNTFERGADELYYYDFYSIEVFGKTKIGQKLLYAKQSENKALIKEITETIRKPIQDLIDRKAIDAVAYIQPTIPRNVQFMKVLEKELSLSLPKITITKVVTDIRIPQKTLKKLKDRIENANETFVVEKGGIYQKVLLIDDAVGSGASINQVALKIKEKGIAKKVIGFAITGSLNDFDVISEV